MNIHHQTLSLAGVCRRALLGVLLILAFSGPGDRASGQAVEGPHKSWMPMVFSQPFVEEPLPENPLIDGVATYYNATGSGACSYGSSPNNLMVAAIDPDNYGRSRLCGAYIRVIGPKDEVVVRIVDLCPGCGTNHLDLSREAFETIANLSSGRVAVTWQLLSPDLDGPVAYRFSGTSNQWYTSLQVRNHRNPVTGLEFLNSRGEWVSVFRTSYNYFVQSDPGMGVGPYTFRLTDIYGNQLIDTDIPHLPGEIVEGADQFPRGP